MINLLQQMLNQNTKEDDLIVHQEPLAYAMRSLFKIIEYEKRILPTDIFNPMIQSLQDNMNETFEKLKIPNIPPDSEVVSINGEPVK